MRDLGLIGIYALAAGGVVALLGVAALRIARVRPSIYPSIDFHRIDCTESRVVVRAQRRPQTAV